MPKPVKKIAPATPKGNRAQRRVMEKTSRVNREFDYQLPGVKLNFTLRVDETSELIPFRECLLEAVKDIDEQIEKLK